MIILYILGLALLVKFLKEWIKHGFGTALKRTVKFFIAIVILAIATIVVMALIAAG